MSPPVLFLVGLFLAVAIAGGYVGASALDAASQYQLRLAAARENLDGLLRMQFAEETGLRGFVATGQRSFLEVQGPPSESFGARAERLDAELLNAHLTKAREAVARLRALHTRYEREVEAPLLREPSRSDGLRKQTLGQALTNGMLNAATFVRKELQNAGQAVASDLRLRINATVAVSVGTITLVAIVALVLGLSRAQAVQALVREQSLVLALQQTLRVDGVQLPRTAVGFAYKSATREALVGGDLIDTWRENAQRGWFLIADVSGKGIDAARHSAFVQYAIRTLSAEHADPAVVLERFNRLFLQTFDDPSIFVVLFLGEFNADSGELRYASAGHSIAFIKRPGGIEQLWPTGSIIGLDPEEVYERRTIRLGTGDTVVLATDGLTESRDQSGEMLGDDGVIALLRETSGGAQAICDHLVNEAERRSRGEVSDDLAILVLHILDVNVPSVRVPFSTMSS